MSALETTALAVAGITGGTVAEAAADRANIFEMTDAAEAAVLRPLYAGGFSHELRAALAARVARQAGDAALADHHLHAAGDMAALADPDETGAAQGLAGVVAFCDKAANATKDIAPEDISTLQDAGLSDADIVRLCELVAFLAYQLRVVAGLRLMRGGSA